MLLLFDPTVVIHNCVKYCSTLTMVSCLSMQLRALVFLCVKESRVRGCGWNNTIINKCIQLMDRSIAAVFTAPPAGLVVTYMIDLMFQYPLRCLFPSATPFLLCSSSFSHFSLPLPLPLLPPHLLLSLIMKTWSTAADKANFPRCS